MTEVSRNLKGVPLPSDTFMPEPPEKNPYNKKPAWLVPGILFLAPMAGFTDGAFRRECRKAGCDVTVTEMISAAALVRNNRKTFKMCEISEGERPCGIQLFGSRPEEMCKAARIVAESFGPDFIDLNAGCPARKIAGNESGAALMKDAKLFGEMVAAVRQGCADAAANSNTSLPAMPYSVKIRLGWDRYSHNALEIARVAISEGVSFITVHGRYRSQGYSGKADLQSIAQIARTSSVPVVGNGDVIDRNSYTAMLDTGCFAVMIGRASIGSPWIFNTVKGQTPSPAEKFEIASSHLMAACPDPLDRWGIINFRKHLASYLHGMPGCAELRKKSMKTESREEGETLLRQAWKNTA